MSCYQDLLQIFIPQIKAPTRYCDNLYDTCAAAFRQHIGPIPEKTLPLASKNKRLFPCYLVLLIEEDPDMVLRTFQSLIEQLRMKNLVNMDRAGFRDFIDISRHTWYLIEVMTLFPRDYNFLGLQMICNANPHRIEPENTPLRNLQKLGIFEENVLNPARSISAVLRAELLNVAFLCDILGVETCWVMNLGEHLIFDGVRCQLKLFKLPSFCEINLFSRGSFLFSQVIRYFPMQ